MIKGCYLYVLIFRDCPPPLGLDYISKNIAGICRQLKWLHSDTQPDFECPCERVGESTGDCGCEL